MIEAIIERLKLGRSLKLAYEIVVSLMRFAYFHDNSDLASKSLDLKISLEKKYNIIDASGFYKPESLKSAKVSEDEAIFIEKLMLENRSYLMSRGYEFALEGN
jgi:hypothetical protein